MELPIAAGDKLHGRRRWPQASSTGGGRGRGRAGREEAVVGGVLDGRRRRPGTSSTEENKTHPQETREARVTRHPRYRMLPPAQRVPACTLRSHLPAGDMHPHAAAVSTGGDHAAAPAPAPAPAAASEYALYPTLSLEDVAPPPPPPYHAAAAYSAPAAFAVMVVIPLAQLRSVNTSTSRTNVAEKYIQLVSVDNHEFWFMGFVYYDSAVKNMQEALQEGHALQAQ